MKTKNTLIFTRDAESKDFSFDSQFSKFVGSRNQTSWKNIKFRELLNESHPGGFQGITLSLFRAF